MFAPSWFLALIALAAVPVCLAIFTAYHLYDNDNQRIAVASFDEVRDIFHAMLAGSLVFLILSQGLRYAFGWWIYSAVEAFILLAAALVLVPVVRGSMRSWVFPRVMKRRRTLIVGSGREAQLVYRKLMAHPEYGLEVVGFLDGSGEDPADSVGPVLGSREDIAAVIDEHEIDRVLLGSSIASHEEMLDLIRTVRRPDVQVSIVPHYFEIFTSRAILDEVEGMPVVTLPPMNLGPELPALEAHVRRRGLFGSPPRLVARACAPLRSRSGSTARAPRSTASRGAAATARRSRS